MARPADVRWTTGDGGETVCNGPGNAYVWWLPAASQTTGCAHEYLRTSAGQPSVDGNTDDGTYVVVATVDWAISWTSTGVAGGGVLPSLVTSGTTLLRVAQVESVNSVASTFVPLQSTALGGGS